MAGGGEYEPQDSRKVTGTAGDPSRSWREQEDARAGRGEYEPRDQRNVTGQSAERENPGHEDRWSSSGGTDREDAEDTEDQPAEGSREAVKSIPGAERAD